MHTYIMFSVILLPVGWLWFAGWYDAKRWLEGWLDGDGYRVCLLSLVCGILPAASAYNIYVSICVFKTNHSN